MVKVYDELAKHKIWLGMLQPVGLVVSPQAMNDLQCFVDSNVIDLQNTLLSLLVEDKDYGLIIGDWREFVENILEWKADDLIAEIPPELIISLPEWHEVLQPDFWLKDNGKPLILMQVYPSNIDLDKLDEVAEKAGKWNVSAQSKMERLLAETAVHIGILTNGREVRLVYRPPMEMSGHLSFPVAAMTEVSGRLILGAMQMLLGEQRLFVVPEKQRLLKVLEESRKYQAKVSEKLASQVLNALWELLRGFQVADVYTQGQLLRNIEAYEFYGGLITVLLRLVFLLYAEDNNLMPDDPVYQNNYAVSGLYERLRDDAGNYPDTMDERFGAWAHLLSLFRFVYNGGGLSSEYLPARHGELFDPLQFSFLAGGELGLSIPRVSDGVIYRVLQGLLILDGERLSYRSLAVEEIGSVYQGIMGFAVERAAGESIAVSPDDVVINLEELLAVKSADRGKFLKDRAGCDLTGNSLKDLKAAKTVDDLIGAIGRKVSLDRTPHKIPVNSWYLQPTEERRRSGSHYTPASLTQPVVQKALEPILKNLQLNNNNNQYPTPEQILDLKICDPAMGSGAFLVEAARQLAQVLVESCEHYDRLDFLARDRMRISEDFGLTKFDLAKRLIVQCCLYGVDKNPFAVSLAKLSLWLTTLAKNFPFTFVDHALRCGDSLLGLTRDQIQNFTWFSDAKDQFKDLPLLNKNYFEEVQSLRHDIAVVSDYDQKSAILAAANAELGDVRFRTGLIINSFFLADKDKARKDFLDKSSLIYRKYWERSQANKSSKSNKSGQNIEFDHEDMININGSLQAKSLTPFNWEIEFPEVFNRKNPGFDVIIGNPPFAGKNTLINANAPGYVEWLKVVNPESHGNADLVAHFFRRSFTLLRQRGCLGLIATNTIAQGDTRNTGLRFICENGGVIYQAKRRFKWPGLAAVVVSVIHIEKAKSPTIQRILDDKKVEKITAFLFPAGSNNDPYQLLANTGKSFQGSIVLGMGFTFDDTNPDATPIAEMHRLIETNPKNQECIFPYIGGEEVNSSPTHTYHRYVIDFFDREEKECWDNYAALMAIVKEKVKPERDVQKRDALRVKWWQYAEKRPGLKQAIAPLDRVLVSCLHSQYLTFAFLSNKNIFSHALCVFSDQKYSFFTIIQSRIHEIWVKFLGSSLEERLRYTPSDCFETFPFPENWEDDANLEAVGQEYYEFRAGLMVKNNQGLTETYNRFHNPDERDGDIIKLRQLHQKLDETVLKAYGWDDLTLKCDFYLEYEEDSEDDDDSRKRQRKKPWRYRWDEDLHNLILARLLALNEDRHKAEVLGGGSKTKAAKTTRKAKPKPKPEPTINDEGEQMSLLDDS